MFKIVWLIKIWIEMRSKDFVWHYDQFFCLLYNLICQEYSMYLIYVFYVFIYSNQPPHVNSDQHWETAFFLGGGWTLGYKSAMANCILLCNTTRFVRTLVQIPTINNSSSTGFRHCDTPSNCLNEYISCKCTRLLVRIEIEKTKAPWSSSVKKIACVPRLVHSSCLSVW